MKKLTYNIVVLFMMLTILGCEVGNEVKDQATHEDNTTVESKPVEQKFPNGDLITFEEAHSGIEGDINIGEKDVEDWYSINLTPDTYTLYTELLEGTEGKFLPKFMITIYDESNKKILNYSTFTKKGSRENATFNASKAGTYKIKISRDSSDATVYKFSLFHSIGNGLIQKDNGERNDNSNMATPIIYDDANVGISGDINIRASDVEDWYSIELTPDTYTLYTDLLEGTEGESSSKFMITIYDDANRKVLNYSTSANKGSKENVTFDASKAGIYKIKISREQKDATVYKFTLYNTTSNTDRNDNSYMAKQIIFLAANSGVYGDINARESDMEDWYSIELTPDTYTLYVDILEGTEGASSSKFTLSIYDSADIKVLNYSTAANKGSKENVTFNVLRADTYKIKVSRESSDTTVYKFALFHSNGIGQPQNVAERNDNSYMAKKVLLTDLNAGIEGDINIRESDMEDWYSIELDPSKYILTSNLLVGTEGDAVSKFFITMYDDSNRKVLNYSRFANQSTEENATFELSKFGIYKIKTSRYGNEDTVYKFSLVKKN